MKSQKRFGRSSFFMMFAVILTVFMMSVFTVNAQAATKVTGGATEAKAKTLKASVQYTAYCKASNAKGAKFFKFTAPSSGTYKVTCSNLARYGYSTSSSKSNMLGSVGVLVKKKGKTYASYVEATTQGGKVNFLELQSRYWYNKFAAGKPTTKNTYLVSRYGKVKLSKGDTLYLRMYFCNEPYTLSVKITK